MGNEFSVDDYTDPWREAETIPLLHGNAESSAVWFGWVPHPERVRTLTLAGAPPPNRSQLASRIPEWIEEFEKHGVEGWARKSMAGRLGSHFPAEGVD